MTATGLCDENNAPVQPFVGSVLEKSLDLTTHVVELHEMISEVREAIVEEEKAFVEKEQKPNALTLPAIPDLGKRLHHIFMNADKAKDGIGA